MITFRAHVGGGNEEFGREHQFRDLAEMLAYPWIDGWRNDSIFRDFFKGFVQSPLCDDWHFLMATYKPSKYMADRAVIGYFKTKADLDLPMWKDS